MTMQNDVTLLFPVAYKSNASSTLSSAVSASQNSNPGKTFADTLKGVTADNFSKPYVRSAKATEVHEWVLGEAKADPEKADMFAQSYAYDSLDSPLMDCSELPIMRIASTGEIYTGEIHSYYSQVRNEMQVGRSALYQAEIAKGTPGINILEKIFAYNDALPDEFKRLGDW
ncbi:hypothetical protein [Pseudomonas sp. NA-150]|uniref:hypothetical protein n=1 Tax=Pseudomonas sp. NA-150 TaxID=3367525 RepID=UPI0037C5D774